MEGVLKAVCECVCVLTCDLGFITSLYEWRNPNACNNGLWQVSNGMGTVSLILKVMEHLAELIQMV